MASNHGGKNVMDSGSSEGTTSATTVEIKIKTLDSQTYTLCVDKCVPVPALKEQIASVTGVLSEQQRLICRGKVLKDDQLLSAYHVEDGHTLHLVARQPINPSLAGFSDHSASDPASNTRHSIGHQHAPSVVVGTFNISDQSDGGMPDFSRIVSAVLGSFGIANAGNGNEADLQQHISERLSRIPGLNEIRSSTDASGRGQSQTNPQGDAFTLPTDVSMESLQLPVIPDSLSTLSQYLRRLRREFNDNVRIQGNNGGGEESYGAPTSGVGQGGLPTPAALGEVMQFARQLLIEQAGECLMQLTRQLGDQTNVNDPVARLRMQSNALRSGALLQNLGAFLLELGRTTMTLRMGQSPSEAVVNAGPAVFISTSGPNPIMVQPLPFQPGASFGATPSGTNFSVGSGLRPRNIDIRIRTGSVLSPAVNQREASGGGERSATDPPPPPPPSAGAGSDSEIAANYVTALRNLTQTRGSDVRVVPIRISEASRSSVGVVYPVVARSPLAPDPPSNEPPSGLDQLLRNLFPGDQNHSQVESSQPAGSSQETPSVNDEGTFLSNLLHQIMPIVSQHIGNADVEDRAAQPSSSVQENNQDRGASSDDPPTSKRQKTE